MVDARTPIPTVSETHVDGRAEDALDGDTATPRNSASAPSVLSATDVRRNGVQLLKELGIPDGAITTLLLVLATLTLTPFVAGREFGPYTIPQVLPISTYWPLVLLLPVVWAVLLVRASGSSGVRFRSIGICALAVEVLAVPFAFLSAPVIVEKEFSATIQSGEASGPFKLELPFEQRIEVFVTELNGLPPRAGVFVTACRGSDTCIKDQRGVGDSPVAGRLPKGEVSVDVYNFAQNGVPVTASIRVRYVLRRYL